LPGPGAAPRLSELMFDSLVLGVDPGLARLGLAVVGREGRRPVLVWSATLQTPAAMPEALRLRCVAEAVREAIVAHAPMSMAIERVAFNRNQVSALTIARATGAVMVAAADAGLPVEEYSPTEIKSVVTGAGDADKTEVRRALTRIHGLHDVPTQADAVDAVAIALTHLTGARMRAVARLGAR
jgi:crossover junction endodeoxyribonuclease RuvC